MVSLLLGLIASHHKLTSDSMLLNALYYSYLRLERCFGQHLRYHPPQTRSLAAFRFFHCVNLVARLR